jgi:hypothetical protein
MGADLAAIWPDWIGSPLQAGSFVVLLVIAVRTSPEWLRLWLQARKERSDRLGKRIADLEAAVEKCQRECEEQKQDMRDKLEGMHLQKLQEQSSLINAILASIDSPQLKALLHTYESVQVAQKIALKGAQDAAAVSGE